MKLLLFNDTKQAWKRHAASNGPIEILPQTGAVIDIWGDGAFFVKVWDGTFLACLIKDEVFAKSVGQVIGEGSADGLAGGE